MAKKTSKTPSLKTSSAKAASKNKDPQWVYEDLYGKLTMLIDRAPKGEEVELAVLDAVITVAAHFAADHFTDADAAPGVLKCVQLFAERMKETLVADLDEPPTAAEGGGGLGRVRIVR